MHILISLPLSPNPLLLPYSSFLSHPPPPPSLPEPELLMVFVPGPVNDQEARPQSSGHCHVPR